MSKKIEFEGLSNTRDLSGMISADGRKIINGRLIRSGQLYSASSGDLERLSEMVSLVIDFRSEKEQAEHPDPVIPGVAAIHLPVFQNITAGITRDTASDQAALSMLAQDPEKARQYMIRIYTGFVKNDFCVSQYSRFVHLLLQPREKAVLWHCTAGKDRAGFASVLVQSLLGIPRSEILIDYLKTNDYLKDDNAQLMEMVLGKTDGSEKRSETALNYLFGAHEEYLRAIWNTVLERYGTPENFMINALKINKAEHAQLKRMYLE